MLLRFTTSRLATAVLALLGQLTPALAMPAAALFRQNPPTTPHPDSCACPLIERAAANCCCCPDARPETKSCCENPAKAEPAPHRGATITPGGKCSCDRPLKAASAEPSTPATPEPPAWRLAEMVVSLTPAVCGILPSVADPP